MVRADRLLSILLLLEARGRMSAPDLARRLEVSVRTIYRDVEALSSAGVPVYTERGANGGIRLLDGYRSNLTGLTTGEAEALFALGIRGPLEELGFGPALDGAQRKLMAALPENLRADAERVQSRIHIDPAGWYRRPANAEHLSTLTRALWNDRSIELTYVRADGKEIERRLDPLGLVLKAGNWYLVAVSGEDLRTYRVSRVLSVTPTEETFARPGSFDLAEYWTESARDFMSNQTDAKVLVRVRQIMIEELTRVFSESYRDAVRSAPRDTDGSIEIELTFDNYGQACHALLPWAPGIEVLEPAELRSDIVETARRALVLYQSSRVKLQT
jgi:predicted DNA-binding transcriptional regulator YafY